MSSPQLPISPHKSAKKSARTQRPHSDFSFSLTEFSNFLNFFFFISTSDNLFDIIDTKIDLELEVC